MKILDDAVPWVAGHPEYYFRAATPNEADLAQSVLFDAKRFGCAHAAIHREGNVWCIAGTSNWFADGAVPPAELFQRIVRPGASDPNGMRSEVLLNAFCTELVAVAHGTTIFEKAATTVRGVLEVLLALHSEFEAGVAFRL